MQYDLSIPFNVTDFSGTLRATLSRACEFGYDVFAINNVIEAEQIVQKDEKGGKQKASNFINDLLQPPTIDEEALLSDFARDLLTVRGRKVRILKRLTIVIRDPDLFVRFTSVSKRLYELYDIVAVQPLTERAMKSACDRWPIDIISLRLNEPLPFHIQPQRARAAIQRGVYFEVPYGQMLRDAGVRRHVMTNTNLLVAATKSKGIVFSSEAQNPFEIRAPDDVAALARMLGVHSHRAAHITAVNCSNVVLHGEMRTRTIRGAMIVKLETAASGNSDSQELPQTLEEASEGEKMQLDRPPEAAAPLPIAVELMQPDGSMEQNSGAASRIRAILDRVERECATRGKRRNKMKYERRKNKTGPRAAQETGEASREVKSKEPKAEQQSMADRKEQANAPSTKRKRPN